MSWKVGQEVFVVSTLYRRGGEGRAETITKIGRRWAYYGAGRLNRRFDINTGRIDGGGYSSPGQVYPSEQTYLTAKEMRERWDAIRRRVSDTYSPPPGLDSFDLGLIEDLLSKGEKGV